MIDIRWLVSLVRTAGTLAARHQRRLTAAECALKNDGSVVTAVDRDTEDLLAAAILARHPDANLITEERARPFSAGRPLTFVIDPIDGTDSFSQGLPTWAVSVGVLDAELHPIAGIVHAPRLGLSFSARVGTGVLVNGRRIPSPPPVAELTRLSSLAISSRAHRAFDLHRFPGKIRSHGSAALHLVYPAVFRGIVGALQDPGANAWDIAGAHAICLAAGCSFTTLDGGEVAYEPMRARGWKVGTSLLAAKPGAAALVVPYVRAL